MIPATYILTYRENQCRHRRANLETVLAWLAGIAGLNVVVVEQDVVPQLPHALSHPRCRIVFAYNPGPFNKSWGFNLGVRLGESERLGFGDADVIVGDSLERSLVLLNQGMDAVKPYRRLIDLSEEETAPVHAGDFAHIPARDTLQVNRENIGEHIVFAGGSFVIRRDAFNALGGWDERFRGWGGEDDAMSCHIERGGLVCSELDDAPALHLWHPRPRATTFEQPYYADNARLVAEYPRYAEAQLERLAEVKRQLNGNIDKYRPA